MGTIKIKKEGKEYIEGLIVDQAQDTRLYLKTDSAPLPYTISDGIGFSNSAYGKYDTVSNVWSLNLPLRPPGSEFFVVIPNCSFFDPGNSSYPQIDTTNNRRGQWAICTFIRADDSELTLRLANGDDELDPGFIEWDQIYWPAGESNIRTGILMWTGFKWKWWGRSL